MLCARCSSRNSRLVLILSRCQGREEGIRNSENEQDKVKPVSSWCYQRQAGSMKALQRVAWSLIFLVFGVHMVNAEEQGSQAQKMSEKDHYPIPRVDLRWKRMLYWGTCEWKWDERVFCKEEKEKSNSQGKDPRLLMETARVGTQVPSNKQPERTQELTKNRCKGGEFRKNERKRSGRKRKKRRR